MKIVRITTGNWFPRTNIHLREYFRFLTDGTSHLPIDPAALADARARLDPKSVRYVGLAAGGRFDRVDAELNGNAVTYFEDGLLVSERNVTNISDDLFKLHSTYDEGILAALGLLFSIGLPAIGVHDPVYTNRTTIFVATQATEDEVTHFAASFNDAIHFSTRYGRHRVYFGNTLIVIVSKEPHSVFTDRLVHALVFFREFEARLTNFLDLHREVWATIEKFREERTLTVKELPRIRDRLLDNRRDLSIVVARLSQMDYFLDERKLEIDEMGLTKAFRALEAYRFGKLEMSTSYVHDLWTQLGEYIDSTAEILGLVYQETIERSLDILQFIFLIASVAGVLALGSQSGSGVTLMDRAGQLLATGTIEGFSLGDLWVFGGASVLISLVIYAGLKFFTSRTSRIDVVSVFGERRPFAKTREERAKSRR